MVFVRFESGEVWSSRRPPQADRLEVAHIDTNVELARKRFELSMAVAV